jgi:hypothetical protein
VTDSASLDSKRYDSIIAIQENCRRKDTPNTCLEIHHSGSFSYIFMAVDIFTGLLFSIFVALGFVPTFVAMEAAWRMGKLIGKRGEKTLLWR